MSWLRLPEVVPYLKPVRDMVPVAPSNEPDRVAPVELNPEVPPVVTLAVACGVEGVQLVEAVTTLILSSRTLFDVPFVNVKLNVFTVPEIVIVAVTV